MTAAPRPRSPAQIEASRRNGAGSKGPVTPEGTARASRNALQHGLTALHYLVLEDEVPDALDALIATVAEEAGATSEIEARLARRLALALWKGERAERIETALFDAAQKLRPPQTGFQWEEADPLTTFDLKRFNAVRGYQAQQGREISRCLKELRLLRKDALADCRNEPEGASENKPKSPPAPANDDARTPPVAAPEKEPGPDPWGALPASVRAELDRLLVADNWPGLAALGATGALQPLGMQPEDLAAPEALGRALRRTRPAVPPDDDDSTAAVRGSRHREMGWNLNDSLVTSRRS
jgi:hypothetical protein